LVWQNTQNIPMFKDLQKARDYCKALQLEDYAWHLPTQSELLSLSLKRVRPSMHPKIKHGRNKAYLAHDGPIWDKRLHYGFNFKDASMMVFEKEQQLLSVRCAASLE
ncbi:MAG: hypothetical protein OEW60_04730, partial [Thiovulaceae bacterium]|nr:hypothetical protein [Sulfurimonadaceae bacterium]